MKRLKVVFVPCRNCIGTSRGAFVHHSCYEPRIGDHYILGEDDIRRFQSIKYQLPLSSDNTEHNTSVSKMSPKSSSLHHDLSTFETSCISFRYRKDANLR